MGVAGLGEQGQGLGPWVNRHPPGLTSSTVLRGRVQYSCRSSWPGPDASSISFSRSSSWGERQASSSKKERRGTLAMSRYCDTRCLTEQGWGSPTRLGASAVASRRPWWPVEDMGGQGRAEEGQLHPAHLAPVAPAGSAGQGPGPAPGRTAGRAGRHWLAGSAPRRRQCSWWEGSHVGGAGGLASPLGLCPQPSPDARACYVKLYQANVLEVRGAGHPLVADDGGQEGPCLCRGAPRLSHVWLLWAPTGGLLEELQGEPGREAVGRGRCHTWASFWGPAHPTAGLTGPQLTGLRGGSQ